MFAFEIVANWGGRSCFSMSLHNKTQALGPISSPRAKRRRRWVLLEEDWGEKPEGDPGCCRLQNSRIMTFSGMLPPACH